MANYKILSGKRGLKFQSPSAGVKFKLDGRWVGATRLISSLSPDIQLAYMTAQRQIAKRLLRIVKGHIRNQDLWNGVPLSESTIGRKGHDKVYIDTGKYQRSIKIITRGFRIYVGIPKSVTNERGQSYGDIASMLEYGFMAQGKYKVPPRPLWEPSRKEISRRYVKRVFSLHLSKIMMTKYGVRPRILV